MLAELAAMGMDLARGVHRQAAADQDADLGLAFARIARAVRQTVALEAKLAADAQVQARQVTAAQAGRAAAERRRIRQTKDRVRQFVAAAIEADGDGGDGENLLYDLDERLDDPDIEAELGNRPIGVIVAGICGDLGVEVDLSRFTDAELGFDPASMNRVGASGGDAGPASGPGHAARGTVELAGAVDGAPAPPWPPRPEAGHDPP